jgi:Holliday junction resolvase-like predicted endonuclease
VGDVTGRLGGADDTVRLGRTYSTDRFRQGRVAETLAASLLRRHGARILHRDLEIGGGDIDLVVDLAGARVAVEVRSRWVADPLEAFDRSKLDRVWTLARMAGCGRVDLVAVRFDRRGAELHWIPGVT